MIVWQRWLSEERYSYFTNSYCLIKASKGNVKTGEVRPIYLVKLPILSLGLWQYLVGLFEQQKTFEINPKVSIPHFLCPGQSPVVGPSIYGFNSWIVGDVGSVLDENSM